MTPHLLVVEDDPDLTNLLERAFTEEGYRVRLTRSGEDALQIASGLPFDLIVLDVLLPGIDGLETLRLLRRSGCRTPVVVLTALSSPRHRVEGLDASADDYVAKPFDLDELLARMRAVRRRVGGTPSEAWRVGDIVVSEANRSITRRGTDVELTERQYRLLVVLLRNAGRTLERYRLAELAWEGDPPLDSNVVDVHIAAIRRRVDQPFGTSNLRTVRGLGYRWDPRAGDTTC
ncbi:MAG: response regulator transcription factor [Acidimicrobiia bacterium]